MSLSYNFYERKYFSNFEKQFKSRGNRSSGIFSNLEENQFADAIINDDFNRFSELINKINLNAVSNDYEDTFLMIASSVNHFIMVKYLIEKGININISSNFTSFTALTCAVLNNSYESIEILLINGANPLLVGNSVHSKYRSPLNALDYAYEKELESKNFSKTVRLIEDYILYF